MLIQTSNGKVLNMEHVKRLEIERGHISTHIVAFDTDNKTHKVSEHNSWHEAEEQINKMCSKPCDIFKFYNFTQFRGK